MADAPIALAQITLATTNTAAMVAFYNALFAADLQPIQTFGANLYRGVLHDVPFVICPNTLANVQAQQNRHQFSYTAADLQMVVEQAIKAGGRLHSELQSDEQGLSATVLDPDGNTIVFSQAR